MAFDRSVGRPRPNEEAIAKPAARAANDSIAITSTGGRGADLATMA